MIAMLRKYGLISAVLLSLVSCDVEPPVFGEGVAGQGSTLARFTIAGDELYILDGNSVRHFDISDPNQPLEGERITVDFPVQSIFNHNGYLYMSNVDGLNIYDLSNVDQPSFVVELTDIDACTPIAFKDNYAFVGRRQGNECGWTEEDQLAVLDFTNITSPTVVQIESGISKIRTPYAVTVSGQALFVCEGGNGLRIFDTTDPTDLVQTGNNPSFQAFGLVPNGNNAIIKGEDGLYQYDISNPQRIQFLSRIPYQN